MYNNSMINNFSTSDLYTFFGEVLADIRDHNINDVTVTCSEDYKKLDICLMHKKLDGSNVPYNYTLTINNTYWMDRDYNINKIKSFMNAYNKYSDNGTAEPKIKVGALTRSYNEKVSNCVMHY